MIKKYEWRKSEKEIYLPKSKPTLVEVPTYKFYTIEGEGNPNDPEFGEAVAALYAMSYGIRMMHKNGTEPEGFFEYTVYPLEGVWSLTDEGIQNFVSGEQIKLNDLKYKVMIRQPEFVSAELALENIAKISKKKPNVNNQKVKFEEITDGLSLQMLHVGPYSTEAETFSIMEQYCETNNLERMSPIHREIYLSDVRKVDPEKNKTVLRYSVKKRK